MGVHAFTEPVPLLPFSIPELVIREDCVPVRGQLQAAELWTGLRAATVILVEAPPWHPLMVNKRVCSIAAQPHDHCAFRKMLVSYYGKQMGMMASLMACMEIGENTCEFRRVGNTQNVSF